MKKSLIVKALYKTKIYPVIYTVIFLLLFSLLPLSGCQSKDKPAPAVANEPTLAVETSSKASDLSATNKTALPAQDATVQNHNSTTNSNDSNESASTMSEKVISKENKEASVTLLAVGDNLIHTQVVQSGKRKDGTYRYDFIYKNIKADVSEADIAIVNQETILGGKSYPYSGYPNFNSPTEIGDALVNTGFDVVLHATNHAMDMRTGGIYHTLAFWDRHPDITVLGIHKTRKSYDTIKIIEKNGIKIALLNYTYGLNGYTLPKDKPYLVNLLDKKKMEKDIKEAKAKADFTIVFPHWGTEYMYQPSKMQKELTEFFYNQGVDLIIGSHPHVLEPVKWIETKKGHRMLVYYSLGNFMSYQKEAPRMLGGMAKVTITKNSEGTYIADASITPIVTHFENGPADYHYAIYKLKDYNAKLAKSHGVSDIAQQGPLSYQGLCKLAKQILGSWY
jgi:Putative enzyme of poly-gamma-glutamate biosynthesis (capsule formation)